MTEPERYEIPPERLERWLGRWTDLHGEVVNERTAPERLTLTASDGAVLELDPPFPPLEQPGFAGLLAHVRRERVVGVLLVRLGGNGGSSSSTAPSLAVSVSRSGAVRSFMTSPCRSVQRPSQRSSRSGGIS